jgi:AcrR family transcriptional regulator
VTVLTERPDRLDPRVRRTRAALRDAVVELAGERALAEVSVGDIAERAAVSRAAFYLHYADRDALLLDVIDELIGAEAAVVARTPIPDPVPEGAPVPHFLVDFLERIAANRRVFGFVLGPDGGPGAATALAERLQAALIPLLDQHVERELVTHEVHAAWLAGALLGVIAHWLRTSPTRAPTEVARDIWRLSIQPAARRS